MRVSGSEQKKRDKRIVRQRCRGSSTREIAENEGMTLRGTFLAVKRLEPQILTALKRTGYDLHKSITDMLEMTQAYETRVLVINDQIVEHQIPDNATRLKARTRLLNLHCGSDIGSAPAEQQPNQASVMVVIGASDDRIEALRRGNEITVSAGNKRPTEAATRAAEGDVATNQPSSEHSE